MSMDNIISIEVPEEDKQKLTDAFTVIQSTLAPYIVPLTSDHKKSLLKMGDGSLPFVSKVMDYAVSDPQFVPPYLDVTEMKKDFDAVTVLIPMMRMADQIQANLEDTTTIAGSEAFVAALSYYNSVKQAAKMNVPGAKVIFDDLSKRFERKSSTSPKVPVPEA